MCVRDVCVRVCKRVACVKFDVSSMRLHERARELCVRVCERRVCSCV